MLPKILISAGVHPEEEAGVLFLQTIDKYSDRNNMDLSIIPCRNTYGFFISENLSYNQTFMTCDFGVLYLINKRLLFVPSLAFMRTHRNQDMMDLLNDSVSEKGYEGFLDILSLRKSSRLHANTFYVHEGQLLDLNSRSSTIDKVFEFSTNNLLKTHNPNYFIDLHESKGEECYMYVSRDNPKALSLSLQIVSNLIANGVPVRDNAKDRERLQTGVFALESFRDYYYCPNRNPVEILFETGIDATIDQRLLWISVFMNAFFRLFKTVNYD